MIDPDQSSRRVGRPGSGGRLPRSTPFTSTSATASLILELGQPELERVNGSQLLVWPVDPEGDGIIFARLSGREVHGGETVMGQVHPLRALASRAELRPRLIVVGTDNSGLRRFEHRPDFAVAEQAIRLGWCRWMAWRGPDRIARDILPAETYYDLLRRHDVDLYLGALGRKVDWHQDRIYLRALGIVSAEEAASIKERTHTAIRARYPQSGRGWPGSARFGFRRNWARFLEVDETQWEYVKRIHYGFADATNDARSGVRKIADELAQLGCDLSPQRIHTILRDPIYVTGEFVCTVDGIEVPQTPIRLDDPIPSEVFQRNQEILAIRSSRRTTTPLGTFCLNGLTVVHEECEHERHPVHGRARICGRIDHGHLVYKHKPWIPRQCRGLVLDRDVLESAVLTRLCDLTKSVPLRELWVHTQNEHRFGFSPQILTPRDRSQLRRHIEDRERQRAQLTRSYIERAASGAAANEVAYWDLVGALQAEIDQLRRRLDVAVIDPLIGSVELASFEDGLLALCDPTATLDAGDLIRRHALLRSLIRDIRISTRGNVLSIKLRLRITT
jgi:hypothetical protein